MTLTRPKGCTKNVQNGANLKLPLLLRRIKKVGGGQLQIPGSFLTLYCHRESIKINRQKVRLIVLYVKKTPNSRIARESENH